MADSCARYLTKDELDCLISASEDIRNRVIIQLVFNSGCHVSEISKMQINHIDFANAHIHIPAENARNNNARTVHISETVASDICAYLKNEHRYNYNANNDGGHNDNGSNESGGSNNGNDEYLFRSRQSPSITVRRIQQIVHCCAEKAGIQETYATGKDGRNLYRVTPHTIRQSHVVHALLNGVPVEAIRNQAGQKHIAHINLLKDNIKGGSDSKMDIEKVKKAYNQSGFE